MSERTNAKGYHPPEVVLLDVQVHSDVPLPGNVSSHRSSACINCGLCALLCPDFAIYVEDGGMQAPEKIKPIHRIEVGP